MSGHGYTKLMRGFEFSYTHDPAKEQAGPPRPTTHRTLICGACFPAYGGEEYTLRPLYVFGEACLMCGRWLTQADNTAGRVHWVPLRAWERFSGRRIAMGYGDSEASAAARLVGQTITAATFEEGDDPGGNALTLRFGDGSAVRIEAGASMDGSLGYLEFRTVE